MGDLLSTIRDEIIKERDGFANVYSHYSSFPESIKAHFEFNKTIVLNEGPLSREEREFLAYQTSLSNDCPYCIHHHKTAYENFQSKDSKRKELLAELARELTVHPKNAHQLKPKFSEQGFSEAEWAHAINVVAYFNFSNRLAFAENIELEENFEQTCK